MPEVELQCFQEVSLRRGEIHGFEMFDEREDRQKVVFRDALFQVTLLFTRVAHQKPESFAALFHTVEAIPMMGL